MAVTVEPWREIDTLNKLCQLCDDEIECVSVKRGRTSKYQALFSQTTDTIALKKNLESLTDLLKIEVTKYHLLVSKDSSMEDSHLILISCAKCILTMSQSLCALLFSCSSSSSESSSSSMSSGAMTEDDGLSSSLLCEFAQSELIDQFCHELLTDLKSYFVFVSEVQDRRAALTTDMTPSLSLLWNTLDQWRDLLKSVCDIHELNERILLSKMQSNLSMIKDAQSEFCESIEEYQRIGIITKDKELTPQCLHQMSLAQKRAKRAKRMHHKKHLIDDEMDDSTLFEADVIGDDDNDSEEEGGRGSAKLDGHCESEECKDERKLCERLESLMMDHDCDSEMDEEMSPKMMMRGMSELKLQRLLFVERMFPVIISVMTVCKRDRILRSLKSDERSLQSLFTISEGLPCLMDNLCVSVYFELSEDDNGDGTQGEGSSFEQLCRGLLHSLGICVSLPFDVSLPVHNSTSKKNKSKRGTSARKLMSFGEFRKRCHRQINKLDKHVTSNLV